MSGPTCAFEYVPSRSRKRGSLSVVEFACIDEVEGSLIVRGGRLVYRCGEKWGGIGFFVTSLWWHSFVAWGIAGAAVF